MNIRIVRSGSGGNSAIVWADDEALILEAGRSTGRATRRVMDELGIERRRVLGVFVTHAHSDHLDEQTLRVHGLEAPVLTHEATWRVLERRAGRVRAPHAALKPGREVHVGGFRVTPFAVPHGPVGVPVGFRIEHGGRRLAYTTDLGHAPGHVMPMLEGCDAMVIESNHDPEMERESDRPPETIDWILSDHGHLSNEQCAEILRHVMTSDERRPHTIVLAHLSQDCNTPALALKTARKVVGRRARLIAADQNDGAPTVQV